MKKDILYLDPTCLYRNIIEFADRVEEIKTLSLLEQYRIFTSDLRYERKLAEWEMNRLLFRAVESLLTSHDFLESILLLNSLEGLIQKPLTLWKKEAFSAYVHIFWNIKVQLERMLKSFWELQMPKVLSLTETEANIASFLPFFEKESSNQTRLYLLGNRNPDPYVPIHIEGYDVKKFKAKCPEYYSFIQRRLTLKENYKKLLLLYGIEWMDHQFIAWRAYVMEHVADNAWRNIFCEFCKESILLMTDSEVIVKKKPENPLKFQLTLF